MYWHRHFLFLNNKYTLDNKRYQTFNYYLKNKYHQKVAKVIIDGHFTCPNRDGKKGFGGCIYCSSNGSGDSNLNIKDDVLTQYNKNKLVMDRKWNNGLYIPYFQSFSNTYGPLDKIQAMLEPFLDKEEVAELAIATRCDCLDEEIVNYLNSITLKKPIWIELGLQTTNYESSKFLNLGYNFDDFKKAISLLENTNIKVCVHIINGLPYENKEDMLKTIKDINHLKNAEQAYLELAQKYKFETIECFEDENPKSIAEISELVYKKVKPFMNKRV